MEKEIYVFTESFPYGIGEAFLNSEAVFLSQYFETVHYVPLWQNGSMREIPNGTKVESPLLGFNPKGNFKLILKGLFCLSPFLFAIPVFFKEKAWSGRKRFWDFATAFLLTRAAYSALKIKFDKKALIYSYWGDKSALLIPFLKEKYGCKCVARFHRVDLYEEACGGYKPFRKWLFESLDVAMPISDDGKRYLEERYGKDAPKTIEVHRLGVLDRGLNPPAEGNVFQIVSCSNIVPVKRVAFLAEVIGGLGFNVRWTHIGDGPLRAEVEAVVAKFPENVEGVLLGAMPNAQVLEYYSRHHVDLFINVSESEGVPVSIMEALSFGIPVMATNSGGVSEIVDDSVGKLFSIDVTASRLNISITEFYNEKNKDSMRVEARKRWLELCDATQQYAAFSKFLMETMASQNRD